MVRLYVDGLIFSRQPHGGISRVFSNLLVALARRDDIGITLHLCRDACHRAGEFPGVSVAFLPAPPRLRPSRFFGQLNAAWHSLALRKHWAQCGNGVFHSTFYSTHTALRIPQVLTIQDMIYEEFPTLFAGACAAHHVHDKAAAVQAAAALVFPSDASRRDAAKHYEVGSRPTAVIPYALDDGFRQGATPAEVLDFKRAHSGGMNIVLHTGSRYLHKNFGFLLCAFALWTGRDRYRLVAVGGGAVTSEESALIKGLGIEGRVSIIPALADRELVIAYHAASAFAFPSLSEGYGFPLLEAMACGVPTVALRAGSLPEVGQDVPLWVEPGDLSQMVAALDEAVRLGPSTPQVWRGVELATRRTWDDVAAEHVEVYRCVADVR
jgi:glycosyltransferase involved in cell wall biosynthesis